MRTSLLFIAAVALFAGGARVAFNGFYHYSYWVMLGSQQQMATYRAEIESAFMQSLGRAALLIACGLVMGGLSWLSRRAQKQSGSQRAEQKEEPQTAAP